MRNSYVRIGGVYLARVSGRLVPVRIESMTHVRRGVQFRTAWRGRNLVTGRTVLFRSARRLLPSLLTPLYEMLVHAAENASEPAKTSVRDAIGELARSCLDGVIEHVSIAISSSPDTNNDELVQALKFANLLRQKEIVENRLYV